MRCSIVLLLPSVVAACSPDGADFEGFPSRERLRLGDLEPSGVCRERTVDADGNVSTYVWRGSADGVPTSITERGPSGRTKTTMFRQEGDDVEVLVNDSGTRTWEWQTLQGGNVVAQGQTRWYGGEEIQEGAGEWFYDADGGLSGFETAGADPYQLTWSVDDEGRMVSMRETGAFAPSDMSWDWDDAGRLAGWAVHEDGGFRGDVTAWTADGLPTAATGHGDNSAGDAWEEAWTWSWDGHDHLTSESLVRGDRSYTWTLSWTYSEDGSYRAEGDPLHGFAYTWAADGSLVAMEHDGQTSRYTWDDDGILRGVESFGGTGSAYFTTLTGPCPRAAWAHWLPVVEAYGPLPAPPVAPRPWGR